MQETVIQWLLEEAEPCVRYRTLTALLERPPTEEAVLHAKEQVSRCKNVQRILAKREPNGLFPHKPAYYGNWTTFTYLTILAELGLDGQDARIAPIVDWILTPGADKCEYFVQKELPNAYLLDADNLGSCRQVAFLSTLVRLGYTNDPRVQRLLEGFVEKCRFDGGYLCKWKKSHFEGQTPKSCYTATVPALYLYAVLPQSYRAGKAYESLLAYFLSRNMLYSKTQANTIIADTSLGFADGSYSQILTIAYSMARLGLYTIPEMQTVRTILEEKEQLHGKYILEKTNSKKAILMSGPGQPNKWITLYMQCIRHYGATIRA